MHRPLRHPLVAVAALLLAGLAHAQGPAPLAQPNVDVFSTGIVRALVRLPDGSTIVGGSFSSVYDPGLQLSLDRSNLAKFAADGSVDVSWNPGANQNVEALAVDASGALYAGGDFTMLGGVARSRIAKLASTGSGAVDMAWNPGAGSSVLALAVDASGVVHAGGFFATLGGQPRSRLGRIASDGTLDATWNPAPNGTVNALALAGSVLYVGGDFTSIGGQSRSSIARVAAAGTGLADATWNPVASGGLIPDVQQLALDGAGFVYAAGGFTQIGDATRAGLAKLNSSGSGAADSTWNPAPNGAVDALAVDGASVYVGGRFSVIGGAARNRVARVSTGGSGVADPVWNPDANAPVNAIAVAGDGTTALGGEFSRVQAQLSLGFARVSSGGNRLPGGYAQIPGIVFALARAPDASVFVGGIFSRANGFARENVLKLAGDGSLDTAWNPGANDFVTAFALDGAGNVFVAGGFTAIGGQNHGRLAKVAAGGAGVVDPAWSPDADAEVSALAFEAGHVFAGGEFTTIGGVARSRLAKVGAASGTVDATWNPGLAGSFPNVLSMQLDGAGALFVGGSFDGTGGQTRANLAKLSTGGAGNADPTWNPAPDSSVFQLARGPDGAIYVAGFYATIGGQPRTRLAKLSPSGTGAADATWNPAPDNFVTGIGADASGVYVGGAFANVGGSARMRIAKLLTASGAADATWNPGSNGSVFAFDTSAGNLVYAGGSFSAIGGQGRRLLAALPAIADDVFRDGFEGP